MEAKDVTREEIENLVKEINKTYPVYPLDFHLELKINGDTTFVVDSTDLYHLKKILDDHVLKDSVGHHGFILDSQHIIYMYDIDIDTKKPFLIVDLINHSTGSRPRRNGRSLLQLEQIKNTHE